MEQLVLLLLNLVALYLIFGLLFCVAFLWRGMQKIDPATIGTGLGFRFLLVPGLTIFWPHFLIKWIKSK